MKENIVISLDSGLLSKVMETAHDENRDLSSYISVVLRKHIEQQKKPRKESLDLFDLRLPPEGINLEMLQLKLLEDALEISKNNQTSAANLLGLSRAKFRTLLKNLKSTIT